MSRMELYSSKSLQSLDDKTTQGAPRVELDIPSGSLDFWNEFSFQKREVPGVTFSKCISDYAAQKEGELTLEEGDIIKVLETDVKREGFLFGSLHGQKGYFPLTVVTQCSGEEVNFDLEKQESSFPELFTDLKKDDKAGSKTEILPQNFKSNPSSATTATFPAASPTIHHHQSTLQRIKQNLLSSSVNRSQSAIIHSTSTPQLSNFDRISQQISNFMGSSQSKHVKKKSIRNSHEPQSSQRFQRAPGVRPLWIDLVGHENIEKMGLSKDEIKRQEIIHEIISTERDYVEDLVIICEIYIKPLKSIKLIQPKDMAILFSNLEMLLPVNNELLKELESRQLKNPVIEEVGDVFIHVSDYLKMYTMYCSNHPYALMKLQTLRQSKAVSKYLDQCALMPECRNLNLANFLLKPVQRICKYPLLLKELIKVTGTSHPDSENLIKAYQKIETVVTIVNEGARQAESVKKILELQNRFISKVNIVAPSRTLLKSGTVEMSNAYQERKKREIYLFNDMMVIAKPEGEKYKLVDMCSFDCFSGESIQMNEGFDLVVILKGDKSLQFTFSSEANRNNWRTSIDTALKEWKKQKNRAIRSSRMPDSKNIPETPPPVPPKIDEVSPKTATENESIEANDIHQEESPAQTDKCLPPVPASTTVSPTTQAELESKGSNSSLIQEEKNEVEVEKKAEAELTDQTPLQIEINRSNENVNNTAPITEIPKKTTTKLRRGKIHTDWPSASPVSKPNVDNSPLVSRSISRPVKSAKIVDLVRIENGASRSFTYTIEVFYLGNQGKGNVNRTYDDFFDLHIQLLGHFPDAAGNNFVEDLLSKSSKPKERILPQLPMQMMHVSEAVAVSRVTELQEYIDAILALPLRISRSPVILKFFK